MSEPEDTRNVYKYFLPDLPVSNAVAFKLIAGTTLLFLCPFWLAAAGLLCIVWAGYAIGKAVVSYGDKSLTNWAKGKANEDSAPASDDRVRTDSARPGAAARDVPSPSGRARAEPGDVREREGSERREPDE